MSEYQATSNGLSGQDADLIGSNLLGKDLVPSLTGLGRGLSGISIAVQSSSHKTSEESVWSSAKIPSVPLTSNSKPLLPLLSATNSILPTSSNVLDTEAYAQWIAQQNGDAVTGTSSQESLVGSTGNRNTLASTLPLSTVTSDFTNASVMSASTAPLSFSPITGNDLLQFKVDAQELWKVEGRGGGSSTYEFAIGPAGAQTTNTGTSDITWQNGVNVPWTLTWSGTQASFTVGTKTIRYTMANAALFDGLYLMTKVDARDTTKVSAGTQMYLEIQNANGQAITPIALSTTGQSGKTLLNESAYRTERGITSLSGIARISWAANGVNPFTANSQGRVTFLIEGNTAPVQTVPGIQLNEGSNFVSQQEFPITIPSTPSTLEFSYRNLTFDTTDTISAHDAFEVSLVDASGRSLVPTIASGRNAFFNTTEGESVALGSGASYDPVAQTVKLNLAGITPGTDAKLVARLINNDRDTTTQVQITNPTISATPSGTIAPVVTNNVPSSVASPVSTTNLVDVSSSLKAEYGRTSFNAATQQLYTEVAVRNAGTYSTNAPLIVAVKNISNPSVQLRNVDGYLPDGTPYYNFSSLVTNNNLDPNEVSGRRDLVFYNPNQVQFTYTLAVLSQLNQQPKIDTQPVTEGIAGRVYQYDVNASDADGDTLRYQLLNAPQGMAIDSNSGLISWTPGTSAIGNHAVNVQVSDGRGEVSEQAFTLSVIATPPNRPPVITSAPIVDAKVNTSYRYEVKGVDADNQPLSVSVVGPDGMAVDATTGWVIWTPTSEQLGNHPVVVSVSDNQGGVATQAFTIVVGQELGNHAPVIVSDPFTHFNIAGSNQPKTGNVNTAAINLNLTQGQTSTQSVSLTLPPLSANVSAADVVVVVDESASMEAGQAWIKAMIQQLDAALQQAGIGSNRYALAGFGGDRERLLGHWFTPGNWTVSLLQPNDRQVSTLPVGPLLPSQPSETTLVADGSYVLAIDGSSNGASSYGFQVNTVNRAIPIVPGSAPISGSFVSGGQRHYTLKVNETTRFYLDVLKGDYNSTWNVVGASGTIVNRSFQNSDSNWFDLSAGDYILTVVAPATLSFDYGFRLLTSTQLSTPIPLGVPVSDTLTLDGQLKAYQFEVSAGSQVYFDLQSQNGVNSYYWNSYWRLLDPQGNTVFYRPFSSIETQTFSQGGTYTLLLEGHPNTNRNASYTFAVQPVTPTAPLALPLNTTITGNLPNAGAQQQYTFHLNERSKLYLDSLTPYATQVAWSLRGSSGLVSQAMFSASNPILDLIPGDYTLTVNGLNSAFGDYQFRLRSLPDATVIVPGTSVSAQLNPSLETDLYQFSAQAGDQFRFILESLIPSTNSEQLRLIDPYGKVVFTTSLPYAPGLQTLQKSGTYTLLIEGSAVAQPRDYRFRIDVTPPTSPFPASSGTPALLGTVVQGELTTAGEEKQFLLTLNETKWLYFDSLTPNENLTWSLTGPGGTVATERRFTSFDWISNPLSPLVAGEYVVTVRGLVGSTGAFQFQMVDLSQSMSVAPGSVVEGSLNPGNETQAYQFQVNSGDRFYFNVLTQPGAAPATWRLFDPYGNQVFQEGFFENLNVQTLTRAGTYTLLVEGNNGNTGSGNYRFNVVPASDRPVQAIGFSSTVADQIQIPGEKHRYSFTLSDARQLYFDALTNDGSLKWSLTDSNGAIVSQRAFTASDAKGIANPALSLAAGTYTLSVQADVSYAKPSYQFRLYDLSNATPLALDVPVSSSLNPAQETDVYQFSASAGQRVYFDVNTGTPDASWRLIDPMGMVVFDSSFGRDVGAQRLSRGGTYTLLIEGSINSTGIRNYQFTVKPLADQTAPTLTFGETVIGSISQVGEQKEYVFTGSTGQQLYYDALQQDSDVVTVRLVSPTGAIVFATDSDTNVGTFRLQESGQYRLLISSPNEGLGDYRFRMLDAANATLVTMGTDIQGNLDTGLEATLYRFNGTAGQRISLGPTQGLVFGNATQFGTATGDLRVDGGTEDGYSGLERALSQTVFRPGAAVNVILVTNEDRDVVNPQLNFASILNLLDSRKAQLDVVVGARLFAPNNTLALGIDPAKKTYLANGAGGYVQGGIGQVSIPNIDNATTENDYMKLAWATGGSAWAFDQLKQPGNTVSSFTSAFVDLQTQSIQQRLAIDLVASDPNGGFQNLSGLLSGSANQTLTFNMQFTGDGLARRFDLQFVRPGSNVVLGSIPVSINNDYLYLVRAVDADGDALHYSLPVAPIGATIDPDTGWIQWNPTQAGTYQFTVQVEDGRGGKTAQDYSVNVTIGANNNAPTITSIAPTHTIAGRTLTYQVKASDPNQDQLSYYLMSAPEGMGIDAKTGVLTWKPGSLAPSTASVSIKVIDGRGGEVTQSFNLSVVPDTNNQKPVFGSTPTTAATVNQAYRYDVAASDPDLDAVVLDLPLAPDGMAIDSATGAIVWKPQADQVGSHSVVVRARDSQGEVTLQSFFVTVAAENTAPVLLTQNLGRAIANQSFQYQLRAQDAEQDAVKFYLKSQVPGLSLNETTGQLSWTPSLAQVGSYGIEVQIEDGRGGTQTRTLSLNVVQNVSNAAPVITSTPRTQIRLGSTYFYSVKASDSDGDLLSYRLVNPPQGMDITPEGTIVWSPNATQFGNNSVTVEVQDSLGAKATQTFNVTVSDRSLNAIPTITSTPQLTTNVGRNYQYQLAGSDADGDGLAWDLTTPIRGMSLDATTGRLQWQPTSDQVGQHPITVRLLDSQGSFIEQSFTLTVTAANLPPAIQSVPPTRAAQGQTYRYQVQAIDPENDGLTFALVQPPAGMTINGNVIEWTPLTTQSGLYPVEIVVTDSQGAQSKQQFSVQVGATAINQAPSITSSPVQIANTLKPYQYQVTATDADGDSLTYRFVQTPPSGMSINPTTGLISWNNPVAGTYTIVVAAEDGKGLGGAQQFTLVARPNQAPVFNSTAPTTATPNVLYAYDVQVQDPNSDPVTFSLDAASQARGMTIDKLGRLRWTPKTTDIGTYPVTLTATDILGDSVQQTFNLAVAADTQAPQVLLSASTTQAKAGETVTFQVAATDNVGVNELRLLVNGEAIALDGQKRASVVVKPEWTSISAKAIALDASGNQKEVTTTVGVVSANAQAPIVKLNLSNIANGVITSATNLIGTVDDPDSSSVTYKVEAAPISGGDWKTIFTGSSEVTNNTLGSFDPSLLQNDTYAVRLTATDAQGNTSVVEDSLSVAGELKLGNFRLSFTDLSVPVTGIPITVTRTYDTLTSATSDDFGYGWRMEFRDTDLRTSLKQDPQLEELEGSPAFKQDTRVYITLPGGKREAFIFKPTGDRLNAFFGQAPEAALYRPAFVGDKGVTSTLIVKGASSTYLNYSQGQFTGLSGTGYNPANTEYGGVYLLTTKDGTQYEIDAKTGDLLTVTDLNGNKLTYTDNGVYSSTGKQVTFERDAQGRITAVKDPNQTYIGYGYDTLGNLISVTDRENNVTRMKYETPNQPHYLSEIIDPLNRTGVRNEYDAQGRLKWMYDALGNRVEMGYDPANSIQVVKDQLGNATTYEYDQQGNIVTEIDAQGKITKRKYDTDNNVYEETVVSDRLGIAGATTTYTYDSARNKLSETNAAGEVTRYTYGAFNRLLSETNAMGETTTYGYDRRGNLVATEDALGQITRYSYDMGGNLKSFVDAAQNATSFDYDENGYLTRMVDALGHATTYTYNGRGDRLSETKTVTAPAGTQTLVSQWTYDNEGRVKTMTDPELNTTTYEYDANGKQTAIIDALGRRTEYRYDERGLLVETILPDATPGTSSDNPRTQTVYDAAGRERFTIDELNRVTEYQYDGVGRLVATLYPDQTPNNPDDNPRSRTEYYTDGLIKAEIDERGNRTEMRYDQVGRLIQTIYADTTPDTLSDNPTTTVKYDAVGRRVQETDALNHTTLFRYDDLGRLVQTQFANQTTMSQEYDVLGRRNAVVDQNGKRTEYRYDALGRLTGVKDALQHWTEYTYDELGRLLIQEDANDHQTKYEYDKAGRRIAVVLPLGQRSTMTYDAVGNLKTSTDFNGEITRYSYDAQNRLVLKDYEDDADVGYTYTLNGQVATITDGRGVTTYRYDERDRLISRTDPEQILIGTDRGTIEYSYDVAGNRTSVTTPRGTVNYTYDERNRLKTVIDHNQGVTTYQYDAVNKLTQTQFANGVVETRQYNVVNQLESLENARLDPVTGQTTVLTSYDYTLDQVGNRLSMSDHNGRVVEYHYDDLYRLTQETVTQNGAVQTTGYVYDNVGNRVRQEDSVEGVTTYSYDDNDRLLSETKAGVTTTYSYDNNGNTISKVTGGQTTTYTWNDDNRLVSAQLPDGKVASYEYDAEGIRVSSTANGEKTYFLLDKNRDYAQVLEEYVSGNRTVFYVYGHDLISQERASGTSYYHVDGLGSTSALTDANGLVTDTYTYTAFGELEGRSGGTENSYQFTGEQLDENLGEYYLRQRYYSAKIGRFVRRDTFEGTLSHPTSQHKYLYTNANPANLTDPTGLFGVTEFSAANAIRNTLSSINVDTGQRLVLAALGDEPTPESFAWETALGLGMLVSAGLVFSLASKHAKTVIDHIDGIASRFQFGQCDTCATQVVRDLSRRGIAGQRIRVTTSSVGSFYGNLTYNGELIANNGYHEAVLVEINGVEVVFDNINPRGVRKDIWLSKLDSFDGLHQVSYQPFE
ncbi:MAG TPA: putative Ig domain-containing protein [Crinalium sp.]|jgi:RHS repeat-associated protein